MAPAEPAGRVTYRDVLAVPEFRALYIAQALSLLGDQLAKIAIALLVFQRSHSPFLTALSYGVTFLPWLIGGPWLSVYADRLPRRQVMITCDVVRAIVILGVAIPGIPLALAFVLVGCVSLLESAFNSARAALVPDVITDHETYSVAVALGSSTNQLAQVLGFGIGGVAVGVLTSHGAIEVDCLSFIASTVIVWRFVRARPPHERRQAALTTKQRDRREAMQFILTPGPLRDALVMALTVVAATIVPEAVAVPYAAEHHHGAVVAGILTAAIPLGTLIGATLLGRAGHRRAERLMPALAIATASSLALTAFNPAPALAFVLWVVGGAASAMVVTVTGVVTRLTPPELRGRVFGLAGSGIAVVQGGAAVLGGAIASHLNSATAVADVALPAIAVLVIVISQQRKSASSAAEVTTMFEGEPQSPEEIVTTPSAARRPEPRLLAMSTAMAAAAPLLLIPLYGDKPFLDVGVPVWWFFLIYFAAEAYPLQFEFRRVSRYVLMDSLALVLGLYFLDPVTLVLTRVLARAGAAVLVRRQAPIHIYFNSAGAALYTSVALLVFRVLLPQQASLHAGAWLPPVVAVIVEDIVAAAAVAYGGYLYSRRFQPRKLWQPVAFSLSVNLMNTCLGIVTAGAITYDAANAWMILIFIVLTLAGFRTFHRLADRHAALDRLYAFAKDLGPLTTDVADMGPALVQLRELLRAPTLEMTLLLEGDSARVIRAADDETAPGVTVVEQPASGLTLQHAAREAAKSSRNPFRRRRAAALSALEMEVLLGQGDNLVGSLRANSDARSGRSFDRNDLRLLQAVADQLTAALEKGRLIQNLRRAATRDSLTGLANLDSLRNFLSSMLGEQSNGVLLLLDVDRFHDINDTLGHEAGDAVLVEVSRRLEDAATNGSLACRVGGDQFALVIPGQSSSEIARLAALAVKSRVDGPIRLADVAADVRVTIGMARAPEHGDDATTLLRRAEIAMGSAKGGSSGINEWEPQMERDGGRRLYVLAGLRQALADSELRVEFQPKLRMGTGEVAGFEALVRWRHPDLGLVPPSEFIPLAEATGLIGALTSSVLRLALETCRRWRDQGFNVGVAVNISARSLDDPVLVGQVAALLTATGLDGRVLTLEITESSVMENLARSLEVLRQLRSLGIRLSIDDFGTGYSSLHQLRGLPVHEVKIDKTFVDNIDRDGADRAVVRAVVELCDSLGLVTVAEGVEQASQAYVLEGLGVQQVQGYFYGRPMAEADATKWMRHRPILAKEVEESQRG